MKKSIFKILCFLVFVLYGESVFAAAASDGTYTFSGWTGSGTQTLSQGTHFNLTGSENNTSFNVNESSGLAYASNVAVGSQTDVTCILKLAADGTNTYSFELTGISANDYDNTVSNYNVNIVGTTTTGATINGTTTNLGDKTSTKDTYNTGDFGLGDFSGVQLTHFEIQWVNYADAGNNGSCANMDFNSFTISNAQAPSSAPTVGITDFDSININDITYITADEEGGTWYTLESSGWDARAISGSGSHINLGWLTSAASYGGSGTSLTANKNTGTVSTGYTAEVNLRSNDGSEFSLNSFQFKQGSGATTTFTITGYKDGVAVSGATESINVNNFVWTNIDLSGNSNFNNIDEFHVATSSTSQNLYYFDEINISAAVSNTTPTVNLDADDSTGAGSGGASRRLHLSKLNLKPINKVFYDYHNSNENKKCA